MFEYGNEPAKNVWDAVKNCPPEGGWTEDARKFIKLSFKFASKNRPNRNTLA